MTVRLFEAEDAARVAEIQAASREASQWNVQSDPAYECLVIEIDGDSVAGFLLSRQTALGERELLNLAIHPNLRVRGNGRRLLQTALERWPGTWYLEVRESNHAAIALYKAVGFRMCGRRERYYHNPPEAGIVMKYVS